MSNELSSVNCSASQFYVPTENNSGFHICSTKDAGSPRRNVARFQRPTALLSERHRSESPATRSKSRQNELAATLDRQHDKYDFESLQREIAKRSGVLVFGNKVLHAKTDDFINEGCLGSGTCSSVYKMRHRSKHDIVMAVKQMRVSSTYEEENKRIMMDLNIVTKSFDCAHIVECFGIFFSGGDVWICMEVMSTCLDKLYHDLHRPFPEKVLGKVTVAITTALDYLKRKHNVMHRDVKPSNMLLSYQGVIKLCDFGISGILKDSIARSRQPGCTGYMAPERLNNATYDVRADIWSLGISLLELATGSFPYTGTQIEFAIMTKIISDPPPSLPHHIPFTQAFRQFVELCLTKDHTQRPKYRSLMSTEFFVRYNREPHHVLEWLKALPLPHLHHTEETNINSIWDRKTPTSIMSGTNNLTGTPESPDSITTLSPDVSRGLSSMSLNEFCESRKASREEINRPNEIDVTLVAAPMVNTNPDIHSQFIVDKPSINSGQFENETVPTTSSTISEQFSAKSIITTSPNSQNTMMEQSSGNFIHLLESKANKFLSQTSSGYGSAGSDSSPGSLGSDSRPPSSTQVLDVVVSNRNVNGMPPLPMVQRCKPACVVRVNKSDKYSFNTPENNVDCSKIPVRPIVSDPLPNHPVSQKTQQSMLGSDQWSTLSLSSRTTHINTSHPIMETFTHSPLSSLIEKFEPSVVGANNSLEVSSTSEKYKNSKQIVSSVVDHEQRAKPFGSPEITLGSSRTKCEDINNKRKVAGQTRSSSVGAQLQRSPAQRWLVKPTSICRNPQSDQTSVCVQNGNITPTRSPIISSTASPLQNSNCDSVIGKSTSPQQYHHHYFYYYYDNNLEPNNPTEVSNTSWMTKDSAGTVGRNLASSFTTSSVNSVVNNSLSTRDVSPFLSGRMCQRLNTHPVPKQSYLQCSSASKVVLSPPYYSGLISSRLPLPPPSSTSQIMSKESRARCPRQNPSLSVLNTAMSKDIPLKSNGGKHPPKLTYRSISQPPKSRDWLSFETEL
ncbi:unnamed protein product [Trichobilharzia szidati]|nr:unnamed protein product [Trichobilharzia szidati]